jgi:1-deoxy-D-xylulose-5-phosphate reductoisomerase
MNKGLEIIEAHHLFKLPSERIDVVIHPQSVIHGLVTYHDGSVLAHLGTPDMRTPIAYVLGWPARAAAPMQRLDLAVVGRLTFEPPDPERFPALRLAREALVQGGGTPTVLNAANETAVHHFINQRIGFLDIAAIVEETLAAMPVGQLASLDDVHDIDREARVLAAELAARRARNHPAANTDLR